MAYLIVNVSGNPNFGGYFSIDEGDSVQAVNGTIIQVPEGEHVISVFTTDDFQRDTAKWNRALSSGSNASLLDKFNNSMAKRGQGESWRYEITVSETDGIFFEVESPNGKIEKAPNYSIRTLTEDELEECVEVIRKGAWETMKKFPVALILCSFLGWLNVHRFYLKGKVSFWRFVTFNYFMLGAFVDFFVLIVKTVQYFSFKRKMKKGEQ